MKTLTFYEINVETPIPWELPSSHPYFRAASGNEKYVFDAINDLGAATLRRVCRQLGGLSQFEINQALGSLRSHNLITRRTLSAHDED